MEKAIVIGYDAVNALGLVQSLGREGVYVIAILECKTPRLINHSRYVKEIITVSDPNEAVEVLLKQYIEDKPLPVFAAGDGVAMTLDRNYSRLKEHFVFEHTYGEFSIEQLMEKDLQLSIAKRCGFIIPYSVRIRKPFSIPEDMVYPCIVKPLVSCAGDKRDIYVADSEDQLNEILNEKIAFSEELLVQQYINRDYEYCMMGCSFKDNDVYVPLTDRPVKFNHFLQETSTVNYIEPIEGEIVPEVEKIRKFMREIKYVGLFSVEFMHDKKSGQIYFTETNFRNDGTNAFIVHNGVNLPYLHYLDLLGSPLKKYNPTSTSRKYIWEGIHLSALIHHSVSFREWISDLKGVDGFLYYFKDDKAPFFFHFINKIYKRS